VYERLSSGLRINTAADDSGGLMLADKLKTQSRLLSVALRNANDGLSYVAVADTGLATAGQLLARMGELANQSANSTYTTSQRSALASEFVALGSEIDRVAQTNTFNGFGTISNSSSLTIQLGFEGDASSRITLASAIGTLTALGLSNGNTLSFSITGISSDQAVTASRLAITAINAAIESVTQQRGIIGANASRLQFAIENIGVMRDNFVAAEAAIRDSDIAADAAEMLRLQILAQSQTAVLAQANQQPALVLKLLG
jgi:flagellin